MQPTGLICVYPFVRLNKHQQVDRQINRWTNTDRYARVNRLCKNLQTLMTSIIVGVKGQRHNVAVSRSRDTPGQVLSVSECGLRVIRRRRQAERQNSFGPLIGAPKLNR